MSYRQEERRSVGPSGHPTTPLSALRKLAWPVVGRNPGAAFHSDVAESNRVRHVSLASRPVCHASTCRTPVFEKRAQPLQEMDTYSLLLLRVARWIERRRRQGLDQPRPSTVLCSAPGLSAAAVRGFPSFRLQFNHCRTSGGAELLSSPAGHFTKREEGVVLHSVLCFPSSRR